MRKDIDTLKAQVKDLRAALEAESDSSTKHIKYIYSTMSDQKEYLKVVLHKLFPGIARDEKNVEDFLKRASRSSKKKKD